MRSWEDLRVSGLLWLLNTAVLHPRGFAMTIHYSSEGEAIGWDIIGDGTEPFVFLDDEENLDCFRRAKQLFEARNASDT